MYCLLITFLALFWFPKHCVSDERVKGDFDDYTCRGQVEGTCPKHMVCQYSDYFFYCACDTGYYGEMCRDFSCGHYEKTHYWVCTGHGKCTAPDVCACDDGYEGQFCEISTCYGLMANDSSVCSGHGRCVDNDVCECQPDYDEFNCNHYNGSFYPRGGIFATSSRLWNYINSYQELNYIHFNFTDPVSGKMGNASFPNFDYFQHAESMSFSHTMNLIFLIQWNEITSQKMLVVFDVYQNQVLFNYSLETSQDSSSSVFVDDQKGEVYIIYPDYDQTIVQVDVCSLSSYCGERTILGSFSGFTKLTDPRQVAMKDGNFYVVSGDGTTSSILVYSIASFTSGQSTPPFYTKPLQVGVTISSLHVTNDYMYGSDTSVSDDFVIQFGYYFNSTWVHGVNVSYIPNPKQGVEPAFFMEDSIAVYYHYEDTMFSFLLGYQLDMNNQSFDPLFNTELDVSINLYDCNTKEDPYGPKHCGFYFPPPLTSSSQRSKKRRRNDPDLLLNSRSYFKTQMMDDDSEDSVSPQYINSLKYDDLLGYTYHFNHTVYQYPIYLRSHFLFNGITGLNNATTEFTITYLPNSGRDEVISSFYIDEKKTFVVVTNGPFDSYYNEQGNLEWRQFFSYYQLDKNGQLQQVNNMTAPREYERVCYDDNSGTFVGVYLRQYPAEFHFLSPDDLNVTDHVDVDGMYWGEMYQLECLSNGYGIARTLQEQIHFLHFEYGKFYDVQPIHPVNQKITVDKKTNNLIVNSDLNGTYVSFFVEPNFKNVEMSTQFDIGKPVGQHFLANDGIVYFQDQDNKDLVGMQYNDSKIVWTGAPFDDFNWIDQYSLYLSNQEVNPNGD